MKTTLNIILSIAMIMCMFMQALAMEMQVTKKKPDREKVIELRQEIVKAIQNENFEQAKKIADELWDAQRRAGKYLLIKEYLLVLYLANDFETILAIHPFKLEYQFRLIDYPVIFTEMQAKARSRLVLIENNIADYTNTNNNQFSDYYHKFLIKTFNQLLDHDAAFVTKSESKAKRQKSEPTKLLKPIGPSSRGELGTFYKYGFFTGDLGEIYSNYQIYKPFFIGVHFASGLYCDLGLSLLGTVGEMKKGIVKGIDVEGKFYGRAWDIYASIGWEAYASKLFSITPTFSYTYLEHRYYTRKINLFDKIGDLNRESGDRYYLEGNAINAFGPGVLMDIPIWRYKKINFNKNHFAIRLRYNAFINATDSEFNQKGTMHELSIGLLIVLY